MGESDTNFLRLTFLILGAGIFILGILINYGADFLTSIGLQSVIHVFQYGRANVSKSKNKFIQSIEVPKSWFAHFYLFSVIVQLFILNSVVQLYLSSNVNGQVSTCTGLILGVLQFVGGSNRETFVDSLTTILVVSMFLFQVSRRFCETVFVSVFSGAKMNVIHYLTAFVHYSGSMLSLIAHSPVFSGSHKGELASLTDISIFHILGLMLFGYGSFHQFKAHQTYANLRKKGSKIETLSHKIPRGGLFELVSCPNYWTEILIYLGFAITFGFKNPTWNYVFLWVFANQVIAGIMNHKWYLKSFKDYPKDRKAIIPYIW